MGVSLPHPGKNIKVHIQSLLAMPVVKEVLERHLPSGNTAEKLADVRVGFKLI
jgi:hypothetical protein